MRAPQSLLQAAMNRLGARLGSGLADSAAGLAALAQEAPERLRRELEQFWSEVELEAERLEAEARAHPPGAGPGGTDPGGESSSWPGWPSASPQDQIDDLRARVAALSRRLEDQA